MSALVSKVQVATYMDKLFQLHCCFKSCVFVRLQGNNWGEPERAPCTLAGLHCACACVCLLACGHIPLILNEHG